MPRLVFATLIWILSLPAIEGSEPVWSTGATKVNGAKKIDFDRKKLTEQLRKTGVITVEAWIKPENLKQEGPARILTFSKNTNERNFTLGQEKDRIEFRLRTHQTSGNGLPGLATKPGSLKTEWTHVVFTRDKDGMARIYLNGDLAAQKSIPGDFSNWKSEFGFQIGDEFGGKRVWKGEIRSLAVYADPWSKGEIRAIPKPMPEEKVAPNIQRFETQVTTIFTQHCLECHDSSTAKGDLDLSRRSMSHTADGILVAGKAADSLLWESIVTDEMPKKRDPLSAEEKGVIKQWIEDGADWTVDFIDPAIYRRPGEEAQQRVARLTRGEYINTVRDTFGVDISAEAKEMLPAELRADGFSNTAYNLTVDLAHVEAYAQLAEIVVERMDVASFAKRFSNLRDLTDKTMISLIEEMGKWVLRGPLETPEVALYRGISTTVASAGGDFDEAVGMVIQTMAQSPRFTYRIETAEDKPSPADGYEMASRLSYILWGTSPDKELYREAERGLLYDANAIGVQAERMLEDDRAVERSLDFVSDWLHLDRLSNLQPSPEKFPNWNPALAEQMRGETLAFFEEVVWNQKQPLSALLNAEFSFVTPALARHYGLKMDLKEGVNRIDFSGSATRGGLLTQGSLLTVGGDEASMVSRGLFVLDDLLRGVIKDPPPCVDTTPKASEPGLTRRAIAMERVASKSCGGCHAKFEPLAYGLEKFDGLGRFHERDEYGNELRDDGEVLFPGEAEPAVFANVSELMDLLAGSQRVKETLTWKLAQWAMGRPLNARDAAAVAGIHEKATKAGGRYTDVMSAIVQSDLVRYIPPRALDPSPD